MRICSNVLGLICLYFALHALVSMLFGFSVAIRVICWCELLKCAVNDKIDLIGQDIE